MSEPTDHQPPVTRKGFMPRGISRTFTLCLVLASPIVIGDDLNKAFIEGKKEAELGISSSLAVRTKNAVKAQVDQLDKVDPMGLGETYYQVLQESQCSWYFVCHSLNGNSPTQHPTLATPEIKLTPGAPDAVEMGREMAMAPTGSKPAAPQAVVLPPSVHFHEPAGGTNQSPVNSDLNEVNSGKPGGQNQTPDDGSADRARDANLAQIHEHLKTGPTLQMPDGVNASGSHGSSNKATTQSAAPPPTTVSVPASSASADGAGGDLQKNMQKAASPNPNSSSGGALFTGSWPFAIPTLRAIRGTPYALFKMAGAIGSAGGWAIVMFLSCTVIRVVLLVRGCKRRDADGCLS